MAAQTQYFQIKGEIMKVKSSKNCVNYLKLRKKGQLLDIPNVMAKQRDSIEHFLK